ncbi:MAG: hypothetical protein M5U14_13615 [Acidimicrobiia bacterium]|nr:hypothetical protein [Acidimicrobiia bacterium]
MRLLAYLDAGAGSLIVSAIVAGFAGVAVFFKLLWRRLRHPLARRQKAAEAAADTVSAGDAA